MEDAFNQIEQMRRYVLEGKAIVLGFYVEDGLAGFAWVFPYKFRSESRYLLNAITVFPQYRYLRIASFLLELAEAKISECGIRKLYTFADYANTAACKFYKHNGMNEEVYQLSKKL